MSSRWLRSILEVFLEEVGNLHFDCSLQIPPKSRPSSQIPLDEFQEPLREPSLTGSKGRMCGT